MTPQQLKAMKLALEALELLTGAWQTFDALDYGEDAITAIKKALAEHAMSEVQRLGQEIEQEPKIGCVNHDCDQCKAQTEQEPVAWPCLIDSVDFSENTITLAMQCEDYKVTAGPHWLSTIPTKETK